MDEDASKVTLREIAKSLGVCLATVSLAMRNDLQISTIRRKQIQEAARRMGYRPNPMASALGHQRSRSRRKAISAALAWIKCWRDPSLLRKYKEFDLYWQGAVRFAETKGFHIEEFAVNAGLGFTRLEKILRSRNIQGLLIPPHAVTTEISFDSLPWNNYCVIRFGYSIPDIPVHVVASNYTQSILMALKEIQKRGYARIGYATFPTLRDRSTASYLLFQMRLPPRERLPIITMDNNLSLERRLEKLQDWIKKNRPEALLTDLAELPAMLKTLGHRIPGDIGLATTSVWDGNADAGLNQNSEEIGKVAAKHLISLLNFNDCGIPAIYHETLVPASWQNGSTLPLQTEKRDKGPTQREPDVLPKLRPGLA
jgi:LacI family transcriptional regulator